MRVPTSKREEGWRQHRWPCRARNTTGKVKQARKSQPARRKWGQNESEISWKPTRFLRNTKLLRNFPRKWPGNEIEIELHFFLTSQIHFHAPCRPNRIDGPSDRMASFWPQRCGAPAEKKASGRKEVNRKSAMSLKMQVSTHMLCQPQRFHLPKNMPPSTKFSPGKYLKTIF